MSYGFEFGGSKSKSKGKSESSDWSKSGSESGGIGSTGSEERVAFEDIFARLFGGAEGAAAGLDPSMLTDMANMLFGSGMGFMDQIGGDQGTQYLQDRLGGDNEVLQQQIDLLGEDLGSFFNEQLLPGITTQAAGGGQLGGGRQGVAQGVATEEVGNQFTRGATALRAGDIAARDAAASTLSGNAIMGAQTAFQGMGAMAGIADMGFSAGMAPYERLAAIMGGPTVLGSSYGSSSDWAKAWSESFGSSSSKTKSSGKSIHMAGEYTQGQ